MFDQIAYPPAAALARRRRPPRTSSRWIKAALAALAFAGLPLATPAGASAGGIELQSTFAGPIAQSNPLCTAEPRATVYGTNNFTVGQPLTHRSHGYPGVTFFEAANAPSWIDLVPSSQAGARSDLCVGFTLPPNVEPQLVRDWTNDAPRLQDDPAWPDVADTHVSTFPAGSLATHGDDLRNLSITLPAGYSANFAAAAQCTDAAFGASNFLAPTCAAATQLGDAFVRVSAYASGVANHSTLTTLAATNLVPALGEAGRIGISIKAVTALAPVKWVLSVRLASDGSGRMVAKLNDAARLSYDAAAIAAAGDEWNGNSADVLVAGDARIGQPQPSAASRPLYVEGLSLRLWGSKANHPTLADDFGAQAGQCAAPLSAALAAATYAGENSDTTTSEFALTDCSALTLPATATTTLTTATAGAPTGATVQITLPQAGPRLPAQPSALDIALPEGLELGPQLASGDEGQALCTAEQFASSLPQPSACPAAAKIGTVAVQALGIESLTGKLYLGPAPSEASLAALWVEVAHTGEALTAPRLKFGGTLDVSQTGQLTAHFPQLPSLRMTELTVTMRGGDHAILTAPRTCGTHPGGVTLARAGGGTATNVALSIDVADGCTAVAPQVQAASTTERSGARTATSVAITRGPAGADLTTLALSLPPGFLIAPDSIPVCASSDAEAGSCASSSQLGSVALVAGAGDEPLSIAGELHLTAAPNGAFAGATMSAAVRLGDLELGNFIAPATFTLDAGSRALTLSATLPRRIAGVAIDVRRLTFDFDRDGVVRHPTACGPLPVAAVVTAGSMTSSTATTVSYAGCRALEFAPAFTATASGDTAVGGHPRTLLTITARSTDAAIGSVAFALPPTVAVDTAGVGAQCDLAVFEATTCPATSKVGLAGGKVAIASDFLGGEAYLVRIPSEATPAIGVRFAGSFGHRVLGRLSAGAGGATVLTFTDFPDLPLSRWALQFDGGGAGIIKTVPPPAGCSASTQWTADLTAVNGAQARRGAAVTCGSGVVTPVGAAPVVELSVSAKTGIKLKLTKFGAQQLQAVKLTMPKTIRINAPKAKRRGRTSIALIGSKATPTFTSGSLTLTPYGGVPSEVVARLRVEAYTVAGKAPAVMAGKITGKKRTVAFKVRLAYRDGTVKESVVSVRLP